MAASNIAQAPLLCQFCDTNPDVKWKCFDCALILCDACKQKLHSKVKAAKQHSIIDIRSAEVVQTETDIAPQLAQIECKYHSKQFCCFFCLSCNELVCPSCVLKAHKDHAFEEIQESYKEKRQNLQTSVNKVKDETVVAVKKERTNLDNIQKLKRRQYEQLKQNVTSQKEHLKKLIDSYSSKLLDNVDCNYKETCDSLESEHKKLDLFEYKLSEQLKNTEDTLNSGDPKAVFEHAKTVGRNLEITKAAPISSITRFISKKVTENDIKSVFGIFTEIKVCKTFTTDFPVVHNIATFGNDVWINNDKVKVLDRLEQKQNLQNATTIDNIEIIAMACNQSGELIVVKQRSRKLEIISRIGSKWPFYDLSPLFPTGMHVTHNGDIVVGVKESTEGANFYTLSDSSRRQVIVLTSAGKEKAVYEYDTRNKRLFTIVSGITSTRNGDICVHDRLSENFIGRIVMVGPGGQLKWEYVGDPSINKDKKVFRPRSVVATNECNIIVSDFENHFIHILSEQGNLLTCVVTTEIGIKLPYSLDIDSKGVLWVGCSVYQGEPNEAKLHALKLNGF